VRARDRVAILAPNGLEFLEATFATAGIGAILVPLNVRLAPREIAEILERSGARALICDPALAPDGADALRIGPEYEALLERHAGSLAPVAVAGDAVAQIYFTSGTTGRPKGVLLTHRNVCAHARAAILELALREEDVWGHFAPMFHLADAWATLAITAAGGTHAMLPRFDAEAALAAIERERVTITNLVPTMLNLIVRHPRARGTDASSLRLLLTGGAPIAPALVQDALATFRCAYAPTYGMTETSPFLTISGRAFGPVELRVVGDDGADVPRDGRSVGEIRARGETVTPGYFEDPAATREAFEDGWLKTGDLAVVDPEGSIAIVDRRKDVIKTGGEAVYSAEVESALYAHPAVLEAAVFGVPDPLWGESVRAAVVLRPGAHATEAELAEACRALVAGYKVPRTIAFLPELPRVGSGKIAKRILRETYGRDA
jgi:fatty-acyl-CoA synthase